MRRGAVLRSSVTGLSAIVAASLAALLVSVAVRVPSPASLGSARPAETAAVTERSFDDRRQVQLNIVSGHPTKLTSPRAGRLTAFDCRPGGTLRSGTAPVAMDGRRLIVLSTAAPLWRMLLPGDRGEDVGALQVELSRLGFPVVADGVMGASTLRALSALRSAVNLSAEATSVVDFRDFVWSPDPEVTVGACDATVGTPLADGDELMALPARIVSAKLSALPRASVPGPRSVRAGNSTIPLNEQGAVQDQEGLAALEELPEFKAATSVDGTTSLPVSWMLSSPIPTFVVPPASLWDVRNGTACLLPVSGRPRLVNVVGSDLGQSYVTTIQGAPLSAVQTTPPKERRCR